MPKRSILCLVSMCVFLGLFLSCRLGTGNGNGITNGTIIIDHNCMKLSQIPQQWIDQAKSKLIITYGHTSHGWARRGFS